MEMQFDHIDDDAIVALDGEQIEAVSGGFLFGLIAFKLSIIKSICGGHGGGHGGNCGCNSCNPTPPPCNSGCNTGC